MQKVEKKWQDNGETRKNDNIDNRVGVAEQTQSCDETHSPGKKTTVAVANRNYSVLDTELQIYSQLRGRE